MVSTFLMLLGVVAIANAGIFKWIDVQGNLHFGDRPPAAAKAELVSTESGGPEQTGREARESAAQAKVQADTGVTDGTDLSVPEQSDTAPDQDPDCFTPIEAAWGGSIADTREPVSRQALTADEFGHLQAILRLFGQRWRSEVTEITCIRPDATEPTKTDSYRATFSGDWDSRQVLTVEADLVGSDNRRVLREFFWFLSSEEGLRFRNARIDSTANLDRPRFDVQTFVVERDLLRFFRRIGSRQRRTEVFELRRIGRGFRFREYFYVQGLLSGKRDWELGR
jgi:hypothetical protein